MFTSLRNSLDGVSEGTVSLVKDHDIPAGAELVLYGVVGLRRTGGGHGGIGFIGNERRGRVVLTSEGLTFAGPEGGSITVTSHPPVDNDEFDRIRDWAPMSTFRASPSGRESYAAWDREGPVPRPLEVEWTSMTIRVDGADTPFEMCDLGECYWAAAGRVPSATVTIDSREVPIEAISLERLSSREPPAPPPPDLGEETDTVIARLDARFVRVPFGRVRCSADYWALRDVEIDHVNRLAHEAGLSTEQSNAVEAYWLRRVEAPLQNIMDRRQFRGIEAMHRSRIARRLGTGFLFQVWMNTVGPGGKTWFGNRYVGIRHYTFRLRWRP
jgi:hypothetical protein